MKTSPNRSPLALARAVPFLLCLALTPLAAYSQSTPNPPGQISYQGFLTGAHDEILRKPGFQRFFVA